MAEAYIVAATRTAGGRKGGRMRGWHPADLAGSVLDELMVRTGIDPAAVIVHWKMTGAAGPYMFEALIVTVAGEVHI